MSRVCVTENSVMDNLNKNQKEFQNDGITIIRDFIPLCALRSLQTEAEDLEHRSEMFHFGGHSSYRHVQPFVFSAGPAPEGGWKLLNFYNSTWLLKTVERITNLQLMRMPIITDPRFEINCKLNYYSYKKQGKSRTANEEVSKLGWHYDRSDQVEGDVVVAVFTLYNELDSLMGLKGIPYMNNKHPTLSYFPRDRLMKKNIYSMSNSLEIHSAHEILHAANAVNVPEDYPNDLAKRTIFVMKFTTDNRPLTNKWKLASRRISFVGRSLTSYPKVYLLQILMAALILLAVLGTAITTRGVLEIVSRNTNSLRAEKPRTKPSLEPIH